MKSKRKSGGYIILEAMLAIVVLSMVVLSVIPMLSFLLRRTSISAYEAQAGLLLQEGVEATYNILISKWNASPTSGEFHPGKGSTGAWVLFPGPQTNLETRYKRSVIISKNCTNYKNETIDTTGQVCREIKSTVSWQENDETKEISTTLNVINLVN